MPWYRVMIRGENFFIRINDDTEQLGFYATRFVEAFGPEDAERQAINCIRMDAELQAVLKNPRHITPELFVDDLEEIEPGSVPASKGAGFTFFSEENNA